MVAHYSEERSEKTIRCSVEDAESNRTESIYLPAPSKLDDLIMEVSKVFKLALDKFKLQIRDDGCQGFMKGGSKVWLNKTDYYFSIEHLQGTEANSQDWFSTENGRENSSPSPTNFTTENEDNKPSTPPSSPASNYRSVRYVGLVNQAMTCYLNSLLQALFMTPEFRNALYRWKYEGSEEDQSSSIPYQLQLLFLKLQTSTRNAIETRKLTKSFGWDSSEAWQQHDIQELCRVMFDALEETFRGKDQANLIKNLYEGKLIDYVKCLECGTEKSRVDTFLDIPLPVRPFGQKVAYGSVEEALNAFVQPETLEGSNQYFCEKCNKKCNAHKGLKFAHLPYILTLHLKRFDFDYETLHRIKLTDKVEFPQNLDLNEFVSGTKKPSAVENSHQLEENSEQSGKTDENLHAEKSNNIHDPKDEVMDADDESSKNNFRYELFSIMIHSGSASGGHYYAYIKNFETGEWFSFNDQTVERITQDDIEMTYGGFQGRGYYTRTSSTSAYMLMYRQIDPKRNSTAMTLDEFPPHVKELFQSMREEEENNEKVVRENEGSFSVKIYCHVPHSTKASTISLKPESTIKEATELACMVLLPQSRLSEDDYRLVYYNTATKTILCSFDSPDQKILEVAKWLQPNSDSYILLEVKEPGSAFTKYMFGDVVFKLHFVNPDFTIKDSEKSIPVPKDMCLQELRQRLLEDSNCCEGERLLMIMETAEREGENVGFIKVKEHGDGRTIRDAILTQFCQKEYCIIEGTNQENHVFRVFLGYYLGDKDDKDALKRFRRQAMCAVKRYCKCVTFYCLLPLVDEETARKCDLTPSIKGVNLKESACAKEKMDDRGEVSNGGVSSSHRTTSPLGGPGGPDGEEENSTSAGCSDQSTSEDSSLTDSDRTIVGDESDFCSAEISSVNNSSDPPIMIEECIGKPIITKTGQQDGRDVIKVQTDEEETVGGLKSAIAEYLGMGITPNYLKFCITFNGKKVEYNDAYNKLSRFAKCGSENLVEVRLERQLRPENNESCFKIFKLEFKGFDLEEEFISSMYVAEDMTVGEIKKKILADPDNRIEDRENLNRWRLRDKKYKFPGKIHLDSQTVKELKLQKFSELYLQYLPSPDPVNNSSQVTLIVYKASHLGFGVPQELTVDSNSFEDFTAKLSEFTEIPKDSILISPVHSSDTKVNKSCKMKWSCNYDSPLEDGNRFLYRSKDEEPPEERTGKNFRSYDFSPSKDRMRNQSFGAHNARKERGLQIFVKPISQPNDTEELEE